MSTITRKPPEWRIEKAVKAGIPREWLNDDGYIRPEFRDQSEQQMRDHRARGYETRYPTPAGGDGEEAG